MYSVTPALGPSFGIAPAGMCTWMSLFSKRVESTPSRLGLRLEQAHDARVVNFPMPGGAIGPNVQMMKEAGILSKYSEVLAEFPVVVRAGGAWTSVTPGSQQYWLQAFNNVLHGRWKKIDPGYGRAVLGYFGRPPLAPDPEVVRIAAEQLGKEPFRGDPLEAAPDSLKMAREALEERHLPATEENVFLVAAAIVPGKTLDLNEGIRFLTGKGKISLPFRKKAEAAPAALLRRPPAPAPAASPAVAWRGPVTTECTVVEGATTRHFQITIAPPAGAEGVAPRPSPGSVASRRRRPDTRLLSVRGEGAARRDPRPGRATRSARGRSSPRSRR